MKNIFIYSKISKFILIYICTKILFFLSGILPVFSAPRRPVKFHLICIGLHRILGKWPDGQFPTFGTNQHGILI